MEKIYPASADEIIQAVVEMSSEVGTSVRFFESHPGCTHEHRAEVFDLVNGLCIVIGGYGHKTICIDLDWYDNDDIPAIVNSYLNSFGKPDNWMLAKKVNSFEELRGEDLLMFIKEYNAYIMNGVRNKEFNRDWFPLDMNDFLKNNYPVSVKEDYAK